jgi:Glycogen recognition site of AMP-activated protein kinase
MDPVMISRRIAKREYAAVRWPFAFVDDRLLGRYWNEEAVVRSGYGRLLGSLDRFAGWLLADESISQRGQDLLRRTGPSADAWEQAAGEMATEEPTTEEPIAQELASHEPAAAQADTPAEPVSARTVDVTFSLPGEVGAGNVTLCGDFNDWSTDNIALQRGGDGAWQVTLPLEPGQSYRFRYLLDGERWENAWQADWYEPNPFGSDNSVVSVGPPERTLELAA